jgi:hypothetical protein
MARIATGLGVAAALSWAVALGAQTPSTSATAGQRTSADAAKEITITGCLSKGADGKYILTNAKLDNPADATAGTSGTTPPAPATGATAGTMNTAASWALSGGTDLDKHVGHKIQVTGKPAMDSSMDRSRTPDTTAAAAGTPPAAGAVGTSGSTATAAAEEQRKKDANANQPRLDVQSVKMVAATCS